MYATGSASTPGNLLHALGVFAVTAGWTVDQDGTISSGGFNGYILQLHKGGVYLQYFVDTGGFNAVWLTAGTGIASSTALTNSSPVYTTSTCSVATIGPGPYTAYHFFTSSGASYLHVAVELSSNFFRNIQGGQLSIIGGASPALYVATSNWNDAGTQFANYPDAGGASFNNIPWCDNAYLTNVGCTVDSVFKWFNIVSASPNRVVPLIGLSGLHGTAWGNLSRTPRAPNTYNGLAILLPAPVLVERAAGGIFSRIGDVPDMRFVNIKNNNPKDELTIGADVWKLFPVVQKNPQVNVGFSSVSSWNYGIAYKKNA